VWTIPARVAEADQKMRSVLELYRSVRGGICGHVALGVVSAGRFLDFSRSIFWNFGILEFRFFDFGDLKFRDFGF
jgi:hypothetical protein